MVESTSCRSEFSIILWISRMHAIVIKRIYNKLWCQQSQCRTETSHAPSNGFISFLFYLFIIFDSDRLSVFLVSSADYALLFLMCSKCRLNCCSFFFLFLLKANRMRGSERVRGFSDFWITRVSKIDFFQRMNKQKNWNTHWKSKRERTTEK